MKPKGKMQKRAHRFIKGLCIEWRDEKALEANDHICNAKVSHKNPMLRHMATQLWSDSGYYLLREASLHWQCEVVVVFRYPNGIDQHEELQFNFQGSISAANDTVIDELKKAMNYGDNYLHTDFKLECVGI